MTGDVEGKGGLLVLLEGKGAPDDGQTSSAGQSGLQGFKGVDRYLALV
jgi:hypothetical protein